MTSCIGQITSVVRHIVRGCRPPRMVGRGFEGVVFNHFNKYRSLSNEVSLIDRVEARDIHTQHSTVL